MKEIKKNHKGKIISFLIIMVMLIGITVPSYAAEFTITHGASANGTTSTASASVEEGEEVIVTATPATNKFRLKTIFVNGEAITGNSFIMPAEDVNITAEFEDNKYTITRRTNDNDGYFSHATYVNPYQYPGTYITVIASPGAGGYFSHLEIDGVPLAEGVKSFVMPERNITLTWVFKSTEYDLTVTPSVGGTVTAPSDISIYGKPTTLEVTPNEGYKLSSLKFNGTDIDLETKTFKPPADNVNITAEFIKEDYDLIVETAEGGTLEVGGSTAQIMDIIILRSFPQAGYKYEGAEINGYFVAGANVFGMPAQAVTIKPVFSKISYNIESVSAKGGSIEVKSNGVVGEIITVTATPSEGYMLSGLEVNGVFVEGDSFEMPASDATVTPVFELSTAPITGDDSQTYLYMMFFASLASLSLVSMIKGISSRKN